MTISSRTQHERTQRSILCIDDDDDDVALLESVLSHSHKGIEFIKCRGGREALQLLSATEAVPDLILLDLNMPLLNGFDCLSEIRKDPRMNDVPVFMLSTSSSALDASRALSLGAARFLTKPNSYTETCDMMKDVVSTITSQPK